MANKQTYEEHKQMLDTLSREGTMPEPNCSIHKPSIIQTVRSQRNTLTF